MRLGTNFTPEHRSPEEWADKLLAEGFRACAFPVDYKAPQNLVDAYVSAAGSRDIRIAEVGVWCSPWHPDSKTAEKAQERCIEQFRLAEYIKADCCVNVSGSAGQEWYACYPENYALYAKNVEFIQRLIDTVRPVYTKYSLEPMQWMTPDSPEEYARLIGDVDRPAFGVHMDMVNWINSPYNYTHQNELINRSFELLGKHIVSCHLKDCLMRPGLTVNIQEVTAGTGGFDIAAYIKAIDALDPDMPVLLEHLPDIETYRIAAENVRKIQEELVG